MGGSGVALLGRYGASAVKAADRDVAGGPIAASMIE
jgi:hypothetical protein